MSDPAKSNTHAHTLCRSSCIEWLQAPAALPPSRLNLRRLDTDALRGRHLLLLRLLLLRLLLRLGAGQLVEALLEHGLDLAEAREEQRACRGVGVGSGVRGRGRGRLRGQG